MIERVCVTCPYAAICLSLGFAGLLKTLLVVHTKDAIRTYAQYANYWVAREKIPSTCRSNSGFEVLSAEREALDG